MPALWNNAPAPVVFQYVEGDHLPQLFGDFSQDLTGFTVALHILQPSGTVVIVPGVVNDPVEGLFIIDPFPDGALVNGLQRACVVFTETATDNRQTTNNVYLNVIRRC